MKQTMINDDEDSTPSKESKTQRKLKSLALQQLGKTLVELPESQLNKIPLEPELAAAIRQARELTAHGAKRRQLQYIGRLMRTVDPQPIEQALAQTQLRNQQGKAQFHKVEHWRNKLIAEGDNQLQLFLQQFPNADSQHLRQLIRNAQREIATGKNQGYATELFRYLREITEP